MIHTTKEFIHDMTTTFDLMYESDFRLYKDNIMDIFMQPVVFYSVVHHWLIP
jgi:hypothetical protein